MQVARDSNVFLSAFRKQLNLSRGSSCPQDCRILQKGPRRAAQIYPGLLLKTDHEVCLTGPLAAYGEVPALEAISLPEVSVSSHNLTPQEG